MTDGGTEHRKLAAIMFTDMVGYGALAQRSEVLALELLEEHRSLLRSLLPRFNGREVKTIGDAFLVEFHSALEAAQCGIEIQRTLAKRNHDVPAERRIEVRIGIHIGDVMQRTDGDVLGDGVNIASRIEPLAGPGGICISVDVERQIRNALEASLVKLGPTELKNIQVPMELFRIVLPWEKRESSSAESRAVGVREKRIRPLVWAAVACLIVAAISWCLTNLFTKASNQVLNPQTNGPTSTSRAQEEKSIAVLPFLNLSSDKENEYFSDGITEDIITALSKISGLEVKARTSSFTFKGKNNDDIQKIGEQLHARFVLEGSVRKAGDKLHITAQLINAAKGNHLWSEVYDRELKIKEIIEIQTDVAERVANALRVTLLAGVKQQIEKNGTDNLEAYNLYLRGRYFWNKRTAEDFKTTIDYFNQAIKLDPHFGLAYAGLASTYVLMPEYARLPARDVIPKARTAAIKALRIDSTLADAHAVLAMIKCQFDWDWAGAGKEFRRAIEQSPNYATAHQWYSLYFRQQGRFDEAMSEIKRAQELDPLSLVISLNPTVSYYYKGDYDKAIAQSLKTLELDPNFATAHFLLGSAYIEKRMFDEAISEFQKVRTGVGKVPFGLSALGRAFAFSGRRMEAQKVLDELNELAKQG